MYVKVNLAKWDENPSWFLWRLLIYDMGFSRLDQARIFSRWLYSKFCVTRLRISRIVAYTECSPEERIHQLTIWPHYVSIGEIVFSHESNFSGVHKFVDHSWKYVDQIPRRRTIDMSPIFGSVGHPRWVRSRQRKAVWSWTEFYFPRRSSDGRTSSAWLARVLLSDWGEFHRMTRRYIWTLSYHPDDSIRWISAWRFRRAFWRGLICVPRPRITHSYITPSLHYPVCTHRHQSDRHFMRHLLGKVQSHRRASHVVWSLSRFYLDHSWL